MTTESEYQTWRMALHKKQIEIDDSDRIFWESVTNVEGDISVSDDELNKKSAEHEIERQKLLEELEALHQAHPGYPDPK